ncbi:MAG: methyltransferase domain-containing protein [Candidatus Aminicenantes bacterium]|nr:methyltransferase domain-containing protein [Candidatus Aminicenantes bacterium]NIM80531.1 methyltransferase domain-containing protein [Candidatus Aminicenantes bacterium]NIN19887.1 methyltransferase domain-containing protein [Candidatus Aminicenantes bacterium]NIN43763.1 methyltransferase domain-containing protein [Candidatus Aminicenantes bacterium]NIN86513.1 methyltransferase domain-containing protein [Candidatus Aminicenantes bacterium]
MKKTDWNAYYRKPYKFAGFTKRIITRVVLKYIRKYSPVQRNFTLLEFGGGNSCFYELFNRVFEPDKYYIVDNNQVGLEELRRRTGERENTVLVNQDILDPDLDVECDLVFSVGLIEHFSVDNTRKAILSHFNVLKKGGILILGFPTPTFLYKITRKISELLGLWIFHDERPLTIEEVLNTANQHGELLDQTIIWSIFLTQAVVVIKKR